MAKKLSTFRLSDEVRQLLKNLSASQNRSEAMQIEHLIKEAAKKELPKRRW